MEVKKEHVTKYIEPSKKPNILKIHFRQRLKLLNHCTPLQRESNWVKLLSAVPMVDWPFQMQAAFWAAFPCLSDTSVLWYPQNQLSMKVRLAKHSDLSELSVFHLCRCCTDSVLSVHSFWGYTSFSDAQPSVSTQCAWSYTDPSPSLPLPPSSVKCRGISCSATSTMQPQTRCSVNGKPTWWLDLGYCRKTLLLSNLKTASAVEFSFHQSETHQNTVQALANCCSLDMLLLFVRTSLLHLLSFGHIINAAATWKAPARCTKSNVTSMTRFWKGSGASRRHEEFAIGCAVSWWVALGVRRCQGLTKSWEAMGGFSEHRRLGKSSC